MTQKATLTARLDDLIAEVSALKSELSALRSENGKLADEVAALRSLLVKPDHGPARIHSFTSAPAVACGADALLKSKAPAVPEKEFPASREAANPTTADLPDLALLKRDNSASSDEDADRTAASGTKVPAPNPQGLSDVAVMEGANKPDTSPNEQKETATTKVEAEAVTAETMRKTAPAPEHVDGAPVKDFAPASSTQEAAPAASNRKKHKRTCRRNSESKPALSAETISEFIPAAKRLIEKGFARDVEDALLLLLRAGVKSFDTFIAAQEILEGSGNESPA